MLLEVRNGIREEFAECETLQELNRLVELDPLYQHPEVMEEYKMATKRLSNAPAYEAPNLEMLAAVDELRKQIEMLKAKASPPVQRSSRKYKLLKLEVTWSTKAQVHAIMGIIGAHAKPGDILDEEDIVEMMERNVDVLATRQGGRKVWNYYKGDHNMGLVAHGNLEKL
jgi:hypothetical protein